DRAGGALTGAGASGSLAACASPAEVAGMRLLYVYRTRVGPFYIGEDGGRFHPIFQNERLGSYHHAFQAAEDLAGGHAYAVPGVDTAQLGIPADLADWERMPGLLAVGAGPGRPGGRATRGVPAAGLQNGDDVG